MDKLCWEQEEISKLYSTKGSLQLSCILLFSNYTLGNMLMPYLPSVQAEEKARVGVRLLGHLLGGASVWGGVQMAIIEIPLSERPIAVSCCPVRGDLLVGSENTLVLFTLRQHNQQNLVRTQFLIKVYLLYWRYGVYLHLNLQFNNVFNLLKTVYLSFCYFFCDKGRFQGASTFVCCSTIPPTLISVLLKHLRWALVFLSCWTQDRMDAAFIQYTILWYWFVIWCFVCQMGVFNGPIQAPTPYV